MRAGSGGREWAGAGQKKEGPTRVCYAHTPCPPSKFSWDTPLPASPAGSPQECLSSTSDPNWGPRWGLRKLWCWRMLKSRWVRPNVATSRETPRKSSTHWPTRACCGSRYMPRKLTRSDSGKGPSERAERGSKETGRWARRQTGALGPCVLASLSLL